MAALNRLSRREAWVLSLTATATMAVSYVDRQTLGVIAPAVCKDLGIDDIHYGYLGSAFALAYLVGAPLAGKLVDRSGARRGLLGAVLVWSIAAAMHALAPGFGALFALRIALGLAESPSFPGAAQTVQRALPPADRARGFGVLFTGSSIGAMIAPPLATNIAAHLGWRYAFLGTAIVGLSWIPIWLLVTSKKGAREVLDAPPAVPPKREEATEPYRGGPRLELPDTPVGLRAFLHPAILRATLSVLASAPAINLVYTWGAKYLVSDYHVTMTGVGKLMWFPPLFFDGGALLFGHFASVARAKGDLRPPRLLMAVAAVLATAMALMPQCSTALGAMLLASVSLLGGGGLYAMTAGDVLARVPPSIVSTAGGVCASAQSVAQIIANLIIGYVVQKEHGYAHMLEAMALWNLPGVLIWILWKPPEIVER